MTQKKKSKYPDNFKIEGSIDYQIKWEKKYDEDGREYMQHGIGFTPSVESAIVTYSITASNIETSLNQHADRVRWISDKKNRSSPEYKQVKVLIELFERNLEDLQAAQRILNNISTELSAEVLLESLKTAEEAKKKKE